MLYNRGAMWDGGGEWLNLINLCHRIYLIILSFQCNCFPCIQHGRDTKYYSDLFLVSTYLFIILVFVLSMNIAFIIVNVIIVNICIAGIIILLYTCSHWQFHWHWITGIIVINNGLNGPKLSNEKLQHSCLSWAPAEIFVRRWGRSQKATIKYKKTAPA